MTYRAPVADIAFALKHAAGFGPALAEGLYGDLTDDVVEAVLEEAGKFATDILAPLNAIGDRHGTPFKDGAVTTPPGWKEAYRAWSQAGWNGLAAPAQWGGQELPHALNAACIEMWNSAAMAFGLGPLLTMAGIDALVAHGSDALKRAYLPKLISGEWMGTMQLTEPQAGSDVGALRTRAERAADGSYRITGQKIFITYGEHDLTDNIIHLVLARLPDAPPGTKGISLFLVPKFLLNADGSLGERNDVRAHSIEHKLGIHASPTCTMVYGDNGGATGFLIGEENRGMACMFTMMNQARLVGRAPGRRHRRARDPAGAGLCARAQAGPRYRRLCGREPDHRASRREAHAAHHARAHPCRARDLLRHRGRARPRAPKPGRGGAPGRARARLAAHARRQGVLDRRRHRGRFVGRAGAWRHGLHRGDRRRAALPRCPHPPDLRGHQRHPGDRSGDPQIAARGRRQR